MNEFNELKPCTYLFSSGTEFECFIYRCENCTRFRNGKCRILNACYSAMFDKSKFPFDDLRQTKYGNIVCNSYTEEKQKRKRNIKQVENQLCLFEGVVNNDT